MKAVVIRCILAVVLFGAGALAWAESGRARRMAGAHERLATLHYDLDDGLNDAKTLADRLRNRVGSTQEEARRHQATVQYWLSRYEDLSAPLRATTSNTEADPELLFVAANAAFRASQIDERSSMPVDPKTEQGRTALARQVSRGSGSSRADLVKRLDGVLQAYATVLKATPRHADAAYNYEYVVRVRDALAGARPMPVNAALSASSLKRTTDDLPGGPTLHGKPGAPPPAARVDEFEILAPMSPDEREKTAPKAGEGSRPDRRG